jgi:hypothetical protein
MAKRLRLIPKNWRFLAILILLITHAIPLFYAASILFPANEQVLKSYKT